LKSLKKLELLNATRMYEHIQKDVFPRYSVALLHGRMKSEEKEAVMRGSNTGGKNTGVHNGDEVGIDVSQATTWWLNTRNGSACRSFSIAGKGWAGEKRPIVFSGQYKNRYALKKAQILRKPTTAL
jgi:hypothetical protein